MPPSPLLRGACTSANVGQALSPVKPQIGAIVSPHLTVVAPNGAAGGNKRPVNTRPLFRNRILIATLPCLLLLTWSAKPQTADSAGQTEYARHLLIDWAGLTRYGSENAELRPPKPGEDRVVFLGDQITEQWGAGGGRFFPGKPYLNRGIRSQTTPQMLVRFRQDVISLKPKAVVILAG